MAEPILLKLPPRDPREDLYRQLENAPQEHAEALLAAYQILQGLHDKGVLELARGALGSGEKVLEILVNAGNSPEVIRGIRNAMILMKLFGALDPKLLESVAGAVPQALEENKTGKPLGLLSLAGKLSNQNSRRLLGILARVLDSVGKDLEPEKSLPPSELQPPH